MLTDKLIESIRRLIGVDEGTVSDDMIRDPLIAGWAERWVGDVVGQPPYDQRPEADQERMQTALAYAIASQLLGTRELREESSVENERFSDQYTVSRSSSALDINSWRADLMRRAAEVLEPIAHRDASMPVFTLAHGRRGY